MKLSDVRFLEFDLSTKCNAACPQCPQADPTNITDKSFLRDVDNEVTLENVKAWFPKETLDALTLIKFCGSFSEPAIARDFFPIIEYFVANTTADIQVHTNGSLRKPEWWYELGRVMQKRGVVRFGIDGLADTHSIYRVNTKYEKIIENAKAFMAGGGRAEWQFILFRHNEHQLDECRALSQELGFEQFIFMPSGRFRNYDDYCENINGDILRPSTTTKVDTIEQFWNRGEVITKVVCKSDARKWLMIDWNGIVYPCCMTMTWNSKTPNSDASYWQQNILRNDLNKNNLHHTPLEEILKLMDELYVNIKNGTELKVCAGACGECVDKPPIGLVL
jgi:sulfatase maturation enzyme AslB (radical SAM superfamily)